VSVVRTRGGRDVEAVLLAALAEPTAAGRAVELLDELAGLLLDARRSGDGGSTR
jgi:hypothetical protein